VSVAFVVLLVAFGAAVVSYLLSSSRRVQADPIDPAEETAWLVRKLRRWPALARYMRRRLDRSTAAGFMVTVSFVVVAATALVVGSVLDMVTRHAGFAAWDSRVARWGADHAGGTSTHVLELVTKLGATPTVIAVAVVVGAASSIRSRDPNPSLFLGIVVLGQWAINNGIKLLVQRQRPDVVHLVSTSGTSFPSGHSAAAAATWAAVALVVGRKWPRPARAVLAAGATLITIGVATSRALLGVHWLTDVIAGVALGWGWFTLVAVAFGGRRMRFGRPAEAVAGEELPATPVEVKT
jgi:membrane-associated phospholipid phosphatase